ncbi:MAG TPA: phenylalanine--tRNA ligase subunit beta [Gammaproteobacteria bacterium]|nr:phenylalanine--tRNA ligase subunit beta [Gammaproteobacteria bacterium]
MKFSEHWLREWVDPKVSTEELSVVMTMAGLEVEGIEPVAGEFNNTVVGQVKNIAPHPDANKLQVCQVDVGESEYQQIVCGAPNVTVDMRVPVAKVGATLPGGMKIKKAKLRGVESFGMLCSSKELGMGEGVEGLMALPVDAPIGKDIREYFWLDDNSIELSLTPNRSDCLGIAGIAREVATLCKTTVTVDEGAEVEITSDKQLPVTVTAPEDCPRYLCQVIEGINPAATTPMWIQEALRRSGLRSLGPVVDITNFVLLELGQPMHAFDLASITGGIQVRHAGQGESLRLLDGQKIDLVPGTLLIADAAVPLALAGIMGGADSAVSEATTSIVLESAFFNPHSIAGRARSYGLHTDSSHRFERGVDPELQQRALARAAALLLKTVGGAVGPVVEVVHDAHMPTRNTILLRAKRIARVLGQVISADDVTDILTRLGMTVKPDGENWQVTAPSFRFDISIEEDLIEELARVYGYGNLPTTLPQSAAHIQPIPEGCVPLSRLQGILVGRGYQEAITYSFIDPELQQLFDPGQAGIALTNPISTDMSVMRTSHWPGLVQAVLHNLNRQQTDVKFFESGLKFIPQGDEIKQESYLSGVVTGNFVPEQWAQKPRLLDFFDLKGDVENLLATVAEAESFTFVNEQNPALHPGQSAAIYRKKGEKIGSIGALHPALEARLGLSQKVFLFEIALKCFENAVIPQFSALSKFPSIRRDVAVIIDEKIPLKQLKDVVKNAATDLLDNFQLFDVYQGKGIDSGRKSVAFGLTFQERSRTLEEADVEEAMTPILAALTDQLGATLRQ